MRITVAICTWNRSSLLAPTLTKMTGLRVPENTTWELLVVDNNSTDDTTAVITSFEGRLPIRRLFEPKPGKSHALNLGMNEASGDCILWTDDDVLVAPDWLQQYGMALRRYPECAFFGGTIKPWFEGEPPAWLAASFPEIGGVFAALEAPSGFIVNDTVIPFGANWAVRADVQRRFPYDPLLGPRPGSEVRGEETAVMRRILTAGLIGRWVPEAAVQHWIPRSRQTISYLRAYFRGAGATEWKGGGATGGVRVLGHPLWVWRQALECELRYQVGRLFQPPSKWVKNLVYASRAWGVLRGE
jgi:hypothetical protein